MVEAATRRVEPVTLHALLRLLRIWASVLAACSLLISLSVRLDRGRPPSGPYLVSVWERGERSARAVVTSDPQHALEQAAARRGAQRVVERIVDSAPILWRSWLVLGFSLVPAQDGLSASYQGRTAYASPDDLRKLEAYEFTAAIGPLSVLMSIDVNKVLGALAHELGTEPAELLRHGSLRRFAVVSDADYPKPIRETDVTTEAIKTSVEDAAHYLTRNQRRNGSFRYELNAVTGGDSQEYNYPRHAGATYFLARAGNQFHDPDLLRAGQRAAAFLRDRTTLRCGPHACIGEGAQVDIGSSALAVLAYVELVAGGN
ncbi:MAG TPA: hypothetical protein VGJ91_04980, partial [Polyangiaceae bacterium]